MSLDINDIVHPPRDLVVPILVPHAPVPAEVESRVGTVVCVEEFLVVSVDGPGHSWPRPPHAQVTTNMGTSDFLTLNLGVQGKKMDNYLGVGMGNMEYCGL